MLGLLLPPSPFSSQNPPSSSIRKPNSPCNPCLVHCCMHWCALCHEHREMKSRLSEDSVMPMTIVNPPPAPVQEMNAAAAAAAGDTRDSASTSANGAEQVHVEMQALYNLQI